MLHNICSETQVTVELRNTLLSNVVSDDRMYSRYSAQRGLSRDGMLMEYTHYKYCDMLLSVSTCNCRGGTPTREHALRYPGRLHPELMCFDECSRVSVRPTAHVNAANVNAITTAAVRQEPWRCTRCCTRTGAIPTVSRCSSSTDAILRMATSAYLRTRYFQLAFRPDEACFKWEGVFSYGHRIILMPSANVCIKSASTLECP
jgi:hypothetical protein